jgi:sec-independent protein translocase protein TatA
MNLAFMFGLGAQELLLILAIVVVVFGASRIPQLMRGMGTGIKEFKNAVKDDDDPKKIPANAGDSQEKEESGS